ncbi:GTP-binding protein [Telmatospirillum sp. J64-1]|uniref:CobW family GTP-binding protein n=1 Tax=Telmatospirillum sp. J64-1 TaxID=2502183 RepID=UPI00115DF50B|nr:GTP-binding protein [Telmatospirillum sp. J64-1]
MTADHIPVNILSGFLGSGKTSLLRGLVSSPALAKAAVIINEFGELGLDHYLVESVEEDMILLQNGCICCNIREDLGQALRQLHERRMEGTIPPFDRVVIETTGLADPVPVLATLRHDPIARHHFRAGNVIVTVDAVNYPRHLSDSPEAAKQIAVADRLVVTKRDLLAQPSSDAETIALRQLNGVAPIIDITQADAATLFAQDAFDPETRQQEVAAWLASEEADHHDHAGHGHHAHDHGRQHSDLHDSVQTVSVISETPIDWAAFGIWLSMLLHRHGDKVLRVKGILNVRGAETPVVINGVQHLIHPPVHLESWPEGDRRSKLVFIARGIEAESLRQSLLRFGGIKG